MDAGGDGPKLLQLADFLDGEHKRGFTRDFRELFGISPHDIGLSVSYGEAVELVGSLLNDPASWLHASVAGWDFPLTRGEMYTLETIDVLLMRWAGDKFKPSPRPWDKQRMSTKGKKRTADEAHRILRPHLYK